MRDTNELPKCPFCGNAVAQYLPNLHTKNQWFRCVNPDCWIEGRTTTLDKWKNRPIEDALRAKLLETRAALHNLVLQAELAAEIDGALISEAWRVLKE